jgi:hypothetical protein
MEASRRKRKKACGRRYCSRPEIRPPLTFSGTREWSSKRGEMEGFKSSGEREGKI